MSFKKKWTIISCDTSKLVCFEEFEEINFSCFSPSFPSLPHTLINDWLDHGGTTAGKLAKIIHNPTPSVCNFYVPHRSFFQTLFVTPKCMPANPGNFRCIAIQVCRRKTIQPNNFEAFIGLPVYRKSSFQVPKKKRNHRRIPRIPIGSMCMVYIYIETYIYHKNPPNLGKHTIHGGGPGYPSPAPTNG